MEYIQSLVKKSIETLENCGFTFKIFCELGGGMVKALY